METTAHFILQTSHTLELGKRSKAVGNSDNNIMNEVHSTIISNQ